MTTLLTNRQLFATTHLLTRFLLLSQLHFFFLLLNHFQLGSTLRSLLLLSRIGTTQLIDTPLNLLHHIQHELDDTLRSILFPSTQRLLKLLLIYK